MNIVKMKNYCQSISDVNMGGRKCQKQELKYHNWKPWYKKEICKVRRGSDTIFSGALYLSGT